MAGRAAEWWMVGLTALGLVISIVVNVMQWSTSSDNAAREIHRESEVRVLHETIRKLEKDNVSISNARDNIEKRNTEYKLLLEKQSAQHNALRERLKSTT